MDLRQLPLFQMMSKRMDWLAQRQRVIAQNIANSDTPNYKARDLKPLSFRAIMRSSTATATMMPVVTNAAHIAGSRDTRRAAPEQVEKKSAEITLSGNGVVLEDQLMKAGKIASDYELTANLYRKNIAMIKEVLGRR